MQKSLDIRHIAIIDAFPVYDSKNEILTVGCGTGFFENQLQNMGSYDIIATDYFEKDSREDVTFLNTINYHKSDIFDLESFPVSGRETVICSEVLEHLPNYRDAFHNLLQLTNRRLIITVPWNISYDCAGPPPEGHCNYWTDEAENPFTNVVLQAEADPKFKSIKEFVTMSWPYHVTISKIGTKGEDWKTSSRCYMIVVDKMQMTDFVWKRSHMAHYWELMVDKNNRYQPRLTPTSGKVNGYPPSRCGPYLPYSIQPMCIIVISPEYDNREWLLKLEYEINEKLNAKLIIAICDSNKISIDEVNGFYRELNLSKHTTTMIFLHADEDNALREASRTISNSIYKIGVEKDHENDEGLFDSMIEKTELNDELIKKIVNEAS